MRVRFDETGTAADVRADPDRLLQVITNLLSNAIKFSPADNEVSVTVEKGLDMVRLTIRDHGPGIPVDFKPLIFEKFAKPTRAMHGRRAAPVLASVLSSRSSTGSAAK